MSLRLIVLPLLVVAVLQLGGCTKQAAAPAPPGGTYVSTNAGAAFTQSVAVKDAPNANIARFNLGVIHRLPSAPATIYIAAADKGIVFSTDDGSTWQRVATPLAITSDVAVLTNGMLVVSGVGSDGQGYILRSADQGRSWDTVHTVPVPVKSGVFQFLGGTPPASSVITSLAVDPFHSERVYAATTLGSIFVGEQSGKTWRVLYTVPSSNVGQTGNAGIRSLQASPFRDGELLVLTNDNRLIRIRGGAQTALRIPKKGEAATNQFFDSGRRVLSVSYIAQASNSLLAGTGDGAVLSKDDGATWQTLDIPVETNTVFNSVVVAASPTNANRIFVAINDAVYRSEDGGKSWNTFSLELPQHIITGFSVNPADAARALLATNPLKS
jgi:photosystem II stability/assembly factor-like uncharacterized protein